MLARNVEQPAGILEKEVMMVTDVGVEIGVRAGKGILYTIAAVDITEIMSPDFSCGQRAKHSLQPVAIGAVVEVTKRLKPSV